MDFECFRKRGRHWQYLSTYNASDSRRAAFSCGHIHNLKVIGVRPAGTSVKLFVYRFKHVPSLTSGSGT